MKHMLCTHSFAPYLVRGEVYLVVDYCPHTGMYEVEVSGEKRWFYTARFSPINVVETTEDFL